MLREEGLIDAVHGLGCFVREPEPVERLRLGAPSAGWEVVRERGDDGRGSVLEAQPMLYATTELGHDQPPAEIARLLGLEPDETVCVRSWQAIEQPDADGRGGGVRTLATAYTRVEVAKQAGLHLQSGPTVYLLLSAAGYDITRITEEVGARMPTNAEAARLELDRGVPVLSIRRVNYTAKDPQPIEVTETVMSAERYRMVYDLER